MKMRRAAMALLAIMLLPLASSWSTGHGAVVRRPARCSSPALTFSSPWLVPLGPRVTPAPAEEDRGESEIIVRQARPGDVLGLAQLCTDSFFGTHVPADGPIIFLQRAYTWAKVVRQVSRRLAIEEEGRECRLLVAVDGAEVQGCCDVAIHLYDRDAQRFELVRSRPAHATHAIPKPRVHPSPTHPRLTDRASRLPPLATDGRRVPHGARGAPPLRLASVRRLDGRLGERAASRHWS